MTGAAFHGTAAALFGSEPRAQARGARHRAAVDLCDDPVGAARPRLREDGPQPLHPGRQGPHRHRLPHQLLRPLRRIRLHRRSRGEARRGLGGRSRLEAIAARFLARFLGCHRRDQGPQDLPGHHRARRDPGTAHLPAHGCGRRRSARLPDLRQRAARASSSGVSAPSSAARTIPNANLPASSAARMATQRAASRKNSACSSTPRRKSRCAADASAPMCSSAKARSQALEHSQGHRPRQCRSRAGDRNCCRCRAK